MSARRNQAEMAMLRAGEILKRENINSLPVDPIAIAQAHDIVVQPKPDSAHGVSGMLLRNGNSFGILYATHIASEGFQRFSIGHELGHYFLDGHMDHIFSEGQSIHSSHAGFISNDPYEVEADHFAVGLLMPKSLFQANLGRFPMGLSAIESLSNLCLTSLTATAIRYANLTDDAVAVIMSTGGCVDYCFLSEGMKHLKDLSWPRKGSSIPTGTLTEEFNKDPRHIERAEKMQSDIDIRDWLGGTKSYPANEEIIGLGSYGKTLTVLSCNVDVDEAYADEDEDDDLVDSWTPRFR